MNLDRVAAQAFLDELHKIATSSTDEGVKTAALSLYNDIDIEHVEAFLKEAGLGALIGGVGKGLGALGMGAMKGLGGMAAGVGRGAVGAVRNAAGSAVQGVKNMASSAGQAIKGTVQSAGSAMKAAPGRLGQGMTNAGQAIQQKLTNMGQGLAQAGQNKGLAMQNKMVGSRNPQNAMNDIKMFQQANAKPAAPTGADTQAALGKIDTHQNGPAPKPPMMGAGQTLGAYNPFQGMGSDMVSNVRGMLQPPPDLAPAGTPARKASTYGTVAPAM